MKTQKQFALLFISIIVLLVYAGCRQSQKKSHDQQIREKIENEFKELKQEINSISIEDHNFREKVDKFVADFNKDMEAVESDIKKNKKIISQETKNSLKDAQDKTRKIQSELNNWTKGVGNKVDSGLKEADEKLEELSADFKRSWDNFKRWVNEKVD